MGDNYFVPNVLQLPEDNVVVIHNPEKECSRCNRIKSITCFNSFKKIPNSDYWCAECRRDYQKQYKTNNSEKIKMKRKKDRESGISYYQKNKDKMQEYYREYNKRKREEAKAVFVKE